MASVPHSALTPATHELPPAGFSQWDPAIYLATYYSRVEVEERYTLRFLTQEAQSLSPQTSVLEFGIGPTLHHLLPFAPCASEIHVADLLPANLEAVRRWCMEETGAFNWNAFTREVLIYEGVSDPLEADIQAREQLVRDKLTRRFIGDARLTRALGETNTYRYGCVVSCYCADSAASNKHDWFRYLQSITSLLAPGGRFIMAALRNCNSYRVGDICFPAARVDEHDVRRALALLNFDMHSMVLHIRETAEQACFGFKSILLASARKLPD